MTIVYFRTHVGGKPRGFVLSLFKNLIRKPTIPSSATIGVPEGSRTRNLHPRKFNFLSLIIILQQSCLCDLHLISIESLRCRVFKRLFTAPTEIVAAKLNVYGTTQNRVEFGRRFANGRVTERLVSTRFRVSTGLGQRCNSGVAWDRNRNP